MLDLSIFSKKVPQKAKKREKRGKKQAECPVLPIPPGRKKHYS
jgi:hypothetical protein